MQITLKNIVQGKNSVQKVYCFLKSKRKEVESVDSYLFELKLKAKKCKFGSQLLELELF